MYPASYYIYDIHLNQRQNALDFYFFFVFNHKQKKIKLISKDLRNEVQTEKSYL